MTIKKGGRRESGSATRRNPADGDNPLAVAHFEDGVKGPTVAGRAGASGRAVTAKESEAAANPAAPCGKEMRAGFGGMGSWNCTRPEGHTGPHRGPPEERMVSESTLNLARDHIRALEADAREMDAQHTIDLAAKEELADRIIALEAELADAIVRAEDAEHDRDANDHWKARAEKAEALVLEKQRLLEKLLPKDCGPDSLFERTKLRGARP